MYPPIQNKVRARLGTARARLEGWSAATLWLFGLVLLLSSIHEKIKGCIITKSTYSLGSRGSLTESVTDCLVILNLRSATSLRTKIYILYFDFCSYLKNNKKNQEIVNSEISSKTPLLQTYKKLIKLPILHTSKNRRNCWKKKLFEIFWKL